ncbi:hypothetical protein [Paenibacillus harenae]|uniref:Uncharacterized protein n=1 Tax=Paenibacillus harenae TaxID=306543 RepID=A0ABT9TZK0_PAEHA|nr:hypothetical protein [Paenibacillus harenae]MDQ0112133.1 hypothetical protein [Paenibacillus harenae]
MERRIALHMAIILTTAAVMAATVVGTNVGSIVRAQGNAGKKPQPAATLSIAVRASRHAALESKLDMSGPQLAKALKLAKKERTETADILPDVEVELQKDDKLVHYRLEATGDLWNEDSHERLLLPDKSSGMLLRLAEGLRKQHYGSMSSWETVKQTLPNKSIFNVTDLESGLSFRVQRRAGSDHADVQPLTKADTATMKQIYGGSWSWKRKAILVQSEKGWIAASMNGMPHGGDGIPENGFSGHFCIHFLGSSTHKSEYPDLAHQLMVHKAGGKLEPLFDAASPASLAKLFVVVMNHQDEHMLRQLTKGMPEEEVVKWILTMDALVSVKEPHRKKNEGSERKASEKGNGSENGGISIGNGKIDSEDDSSLSATVTLPITIVMRNVPERNVFYNFSFQRATEDSPWRLVGITNTD